MQELFVLQMNKTKTIPSRAPMVCHSNLEASCFASEFVRVVDFASHCRPFSRTGYIVGS